MDSTKPSLLNDGLLFSQIDTLDLTDIKLSAIYSLANMFYGTTIKNGLDLSNRVVHKTIQKRI